MPSGAPPPVETGLFRWEGRLGRVEIERRLGDQIVIELEGWFFSNVDASDTLAPFAEDGHLTIGLR